jgi:hypothetical protein
MGEVTGADGDAPEQQAAEQQAEQTTPGFGERGRMRRRARFLRKARELAYRDLGGLVFDLHRFGERNDQVVQAKLATLTQIDAELRGLQRALDDERPVTVLREVGIAACPRCAAIHGRDDRFCPGCGLAFDAHAERPLATSPVSVPPPAAKPDAKGDPSASPIEARPASPAPAPESAAPPKPTAPPVAAPTARPARDGEGEDQPTQILQRPVRGA